MIPRRGQRFLVALALIYFCLSAGRQILPQGGSPAFFVDDQETIHVELGSGFRRQGIYQFYDGMSWDSVISLTDLDCVRDAGGNIGTRLPLVSGQRLDFFCNDMNLLSFYFSWMGASKRMALGVPLHPDRMSRADWEALPGVGPRLAEMIEQDRQLNGDFGVLNALERVRGIGPKRIEEWRSYFY